MGAITSVARTILKLDRYTKIVTKSPINAASANAIGINATKSKLLVTIPTATVTAAVNNPIPPVINRIHSWLEVMLSGFKKAFIIIDVGLVKPNCPVIKNNKSTVINIDK